MTRLRPIAQNLALLAGSLLLVAAALEVALRLHTQFASPATLADLETEEEATPAEPRTVAARGRIHQIRPSANERIVYELKPNLRVVDEEGNTYTTNSAGFRGPEVRAQKEPGTVRIVGLGDSVMYGTGVSDGENFLSLLRRQLDARYPSVEWEIVNTAVPGYNTVMEVETLATKGLRYAPDLVIIMFVGNDLHLPNFILEPVDAWKRHSLLLETLTTRLGRLPVARLVRAPRAHDGNWFEGDPERVPERYRAMVGEGAYRRAMTRLRDLSVKHGFEVLVLQQFDRLGVAEICDSLGLPYFTFEPAIRAYQRAHGIERWKGSPLSVSPSDPHPSPLGHRLYADTLRARLEADGTPARLAVAAGEPSLAP